MEETYKRLYGNATREIREALSILGAGEKETLAAVAHRRMHQAMPARKVLQNTLHDLMRSQNS
jgi:hypothetical protein